MTLYPAFTENSDTALLLFFPADDGDTSALQRTLRDVYACFTDIYPTVKDGKPYVVLEVEIGD